MFVRRKPRGGQRNAGILISTVVAGGRNLKRFVFAVSSDGVISGIVQLGREILC